MCQVKEIIVSELKLRPDTGSTQTGEQTASFPALTGAEALSQGPRRSNSAAAPRRRFNANPIRLSDGGFRQFRVF
jgi:hypothetical protein